MNLPEYHGGDQSILAERKRMAEEHDALRCRLAGRADELRAKLIQKHPLLSWRVEPMLPTRELLVTASVIVNAQNLTAVYTLNDYAFEYMRLEDITQAVASHMARELAEGMLAWRAS